MAKRSASSCLGSLIENMPCQRTVRHSLIHITRTPFSFFVPPSQILSNVLLPALCFEVLPNAAVRSHQ
jgi:hypothetical protein